MATGTRTFGVDETFIEPRVLAPPPTRHALLIFLLVLAAIVHFGTAGWSPVHNGPEGYYASAARDMFLAGSWTPPTGETSNARNPPLVYWLTVASYKAFGVTPTAARMPIALAIVLGVALTFLIGERLANYWRGFIAGLVHLCGIGSFVWGRMLTAEPIFAACIAGAIFCAVRGYQQARARRLWFGGVWACVALACLTKGIYGIIYPAAIFIAAAAAFREARLRFRVLLDWRFVCAFIVLLAPLSFWIGLDWLPNFGDDSASAAGLSLSGFLFRVASWWFPAFLLIIPGFLFAAPKIFRPHEFDLSDGLPLCWAAVGFLPLLFFGGRQDYHTFAMWPAIALCVAWAWDRMPPALRLAGIGLVAAAGAVIALANQRATTFDLPTHALGAMPLLIGAAILIACIVAAYLTWHHRKELAIATILLVTAAVGLSVAEAMARHASYMSFESAANFLHPLLGERGEVLFEGSGQGASSLGFYLSRKPRVIDQRDADSAPQAIETMAAPHPVYLIVHKTRVPFWQQRLTQRFHIFHQATTCGAHVVINNHP